MKISDKLYSVKDTYHITRYDNGYLVEVYGETDKGEYDDCQIVVSSAEDLHGLLDEFLKMPRTT